MVFMSKKCPRHAVWEPECPGCETYWQNQAKGKAPALKFDEGKPMMGLIDHLFLVGLAKVLTFGSKKYASHNWRKGMQWSRCFDSLQRHLWAWWGGESLDPETKQSHLYHASCCLMFLASYEETGAGEDDRYKKINIA